LLLQDFRFRSCSPGPPHWQQNQAEFGFFVDHFTFFAGLLFAAVTGPGRVLSLPYRFIPR
jgi:putative oxidoreductase